MCMRVCIYIYMVYIYTYLEYIYNYAYILQKVAKINRRDGLREQGWETNEGVRFKDYSLQITDYFVAIDDR